MLCESASQAPTALSLSWLSILWKFRFIAENKNAMKDCLEPFHSIDTSRCASRGLQISKSSAIVKMTKVEFSDMVGEIVFDA